MDLNGLHDRADRRILAGNLLFNDDATAAEVVERLMLDRWGQAIEFYNCRALGLVVGGELVGGVVYHYYRHSIGDISITMAATSPRWCTRLTVARILSYPFEQLKCRRISSEVRSDNTPAVRLNTGVGFRLEGAQQDYFEQGVHNYLYVLTRANWLASRYALPMGVH